MEVYTFLKSVQRWWWCCTLLDPKISKKVKWVCRSIPPPKTFQRHLWITRQSTKQVRHCSFSTILSQKYQILVIGTYVENISSKVLSQVSGAVSSVCTSTFHDDVRTYVPTVSTFGLSTYKIFSLKKILMNRCC